MRRSLRWRLSFAFTLLTIFATGTLAVALYVVAEDNEEELIDEVVNATLEHVMTHPDQQSLVLPRHLSSFVAPLGQVPADLPPELGPYRVGNHEWFRGKTEFHVGVRERAGRRYYVLYDTTEHDERLADLLMNLGIGVLSLSVLSLLLGRWMSGSLLRQLSRLAEQVRTDAVLDKAEQLDRETAVLATAIARSRDEKAALLAREREFTAHVGHELRTPLTRIRTSAELLSEAAGVDAAGQVRAQAIMASVDEIEGKMRGLLFLARETRVAAKQDVDLFDAVAQALQRFASKQPGLPRDNAVPVGARVWADPELLALLLDNLLANALRHTQAGQIRISCRAGVLQVSDSGTGIAPEDVPHVFKRHFRADTQSAGSGLGLAIVARICEASGWTPAIASTPGEGTTVSIELGPALA